jgi:ATP-dependent helicase/nuclease subunit A
VSDEPRQGVLPFGDPPADTPADTPKEREATDAVARRRIVTELDENLVVEAAAGTGKTTSLVSRLVALVAEGKAEVFEIAAITFTRKAAGELRERFQNSLEKRLREETDSERRPRIAEALGQLNRSYIGTIHSFCGRMIRERPVEAGVPPEFTELEQSEADSLNLEVWSEYLQEMYLEGSPLLSRLEELDLSPDDLRSIFLFACEETSLEFVRESSEAPDLGEAWKRTVETIDDLERRMGPRPEKGWDGLQATIRRSASLRKIAEPRTADVVRLLNLFSFSKPAAKVTQRRWHQGDGKEVEGIITELCEQTVAPALRAWREYCHPVAVDLVVPAAERARIRRIETGRLSFQDLLLIVRDLLKEHPDVRRWFRDRYRRILVDEFQDTDPIQAEILFFLTGEGEGSSWRELKPAAGSLFIVGDPKQSIYRFRRADITLYKEVKERLVASGGEVLRLSRNFRSTASLCEWVNGRFEKILPQVETDQQAAMVHVEAHRTDSGGLEGVFRIELASQRSTWTMAQREALELGQWLRETVAAERTIVDGGVERPLSWGDFMIITPDRRRLQIYAEALESELIPYEITGGRGFGDSKELRSLVAYLRAVIDPDDEPSLLAHLRGMLAGVSDDALWRHRKVKGRWSYLQEPPEDSPEEIREAFERLRTARRWALELSPAAAIGRICEQLGIVAWSAAKERGQTRSGNLYKALAIARRMSAGGASLTSIVEELARLTEEKNDLEELSLRGNEGKVVRLMNLHQAKGLEAPVVFLVDPGSSQSHAPTMRVDRSKDPAEAYLLVTRPKQYGVDVLAQPRRWEEHAGIEEQFEAAEVDRLLYVAATRARNALVISAWSSSKGDLKGAWQRLVDDTTPRLDPPTSRTFPVEERTLDIVTDPGLVAAELEGGRARLLQPSYAVRTVSGVGHDDLFRPAAGGRGPSWGRVLHRALEAVMRDAAVPLETLAGNLLREEERDENEVDDVVSWIGRVRETPIWKRALEAEKTLVEIPFARAVDDRGTLLRGVIDLAFIERGRWIVVDYKSDLTADRLDDLVAAYAPQVRTYAETWTAITGEPAEPVLLFLDGCLEVGVGEQ